MFNRLLDHCQASSSCKCRRSRTELNQEQVRRLSHHQKSDNLESVVSKKIPLEFFCHFSASEQKWCCSDCGHAVADHYDATTTTTKTSAPPVITTTTPAPSFTFNPGEHIWNKVSKCFSTVVSSTPTSIRFVNFMDDTPFWKPFSERRVENCDHPCVTHSSLFTEQQKQDLEKKLAEEADVDERTKKGIHVCPLPPCAVCGHRFCYETVGENQSDLGGWSVVCCPSGSKYCKCKFCVWKNSTRRPADGENECCQCAKKKHERKQ